MAGIKDNELMAGAREALLDQPDFFRDILQRLLEMEVAKHLNADPYEHT